MSRSHIRSFVRLALVAITGLVAATAVTVTGAGAAPVSTSTTTTTTPGTVSTTATTTSPVVPVGDAALIDGTPISVGTLDHWMYVAEKGNAVETGSPVIVPTDPPRFNKCIAHVRTIIPAYKTTSATRLRADCDQLFRSLSSQALDYLIKAHWYEADAQTLGITLTTAEVQKLFSNAQRVTFPTTGELRAFLRETGETLPDIYFRLRVNAFFADLIARDTSPVTSAETLAYYTAHKPEFTEVATRNLRLLKTRTHATALAARSALAHGSSWTAVVRAYGVRPTTKDALVTHLPPHSESRVLDQIIFSSPVGELRGPIHDEFGWYLVEVTKITRARLSTYPSVRAEITQLLKAQRQSDATTKVNRTVSATFRASTGCRSPYLSTDCGYVTRP